MERFRITIAKEYLGFCAAHFITYEGHLCEALHGHNYHVRITLEGPIDENYYVMDFIRVKKMMKGICDRLDHRMLLPMHNPHLVLETTEDRVSVRYKHRLFVFPREDVVLLPIPNTTAEMLARYLCEQALAELARMRAPSLQMIEVEVEEAPGQSAIYRRDLAAG
ncbi:6-carboxy-5,6,7,8-tetrahydropterin synthase [bacterium HR11]|nr:6-carboxy-5,6,7,8-tetrahydropterin synthase [bacterium HR11]